MSVDLAAVFAQFGDAYRTHAHLNADQQRALHAVLACRTPALGLQRHRCDHCAFEHQLYRSCRNRHFQSMQWAVAACALPLPAEGLDALLDALMSKTWSVYAKPVLGHPHQLLDYLGRYTHL